jgi:hypothetical protein
MGKKNSTQSRKRSTLETGRPDPIIPSLIGACQESKAKRIAEITSCTKSIICHFSILKIFQSAATGKHPRCQNLWALPEAYFRQSRPAICISVTLDSRKSKRVTRSAKKAVAQSAQAGSQGDGLRIGRRRRRRRGSDHRSKTHDDPVGPGRTSPNCAGYRNKAVQATKLGNDRWDMLNKELKELREEIWEDHLTNMKDIAVSSGELGKRLVALEKKVEDLSKGLGKPPKVEV